MFDRTVKSIFCDSSNAVSVVGIITLAMALCLNRWSWLIPITFFVSLEIMAIARVKLSYYFKIIPFEERSESLKEYSNRKKATNIIWLFAILTALLIIGLLGKNLASNHFFNIFWVIWFNLCTFHLIYHNFFEKK